MSHPSLFKQIRSCISAFFTLTVLYLIPEGVYAVMKNSWYDFELDPYLARIIQITCTALIYLVLYSAMRLVTVHNQPLRTKYYSLKHRPKKLPEKLLFFLKDPFTQLTTALFAAIHFLVPINALIMPIMDIFPGATTHQGKQIAIVLLHLILLYAVTMMAQLTAMAYWFNNRPNDSTPNPTKKKASNGFHGELYRTFFIYLGGTLGLCNGLPILISLFPLFKELLTNPFTCFVIVCIVVIPLVYRPIRAIFKRRAFLRQLDEVCRRNNIAISEIDLPYRSIFSITDHESFTVTLKGKRYACKLIGAIRRNSPLGIFQGGKGAIATHVRFARVTIFSRVTQFEFGFDSEDPKILIINPIPKQIYYTEGVKTTPLDNGDVVDGYKVYTAHGFLGALERSCLDR